MYLNAFWGGGTTSSGSGSGGGDVVITGVTEEDVLALIDQRVTKPYVVNLGIPGESSTILPFATDPTQAAKADYCTLAEYWNWDTQKVGDMLYYHVMDGGVLGQWMNQFATITLVNLVKGDLTSNINETQDSINGAETRLNSKISDTQAVIQAAVIPSTNNLGSAASADTAVEALNAANATTSETAVNALALGGTEASEFVTKDFLRTYIPEIP